MFGCQMLAPTEEEPNQMCTWKLITTPQQLYTWRKIKTGSGLNTPSPRSNHSGWEFSGKLWTFGGFGSRLEGYLNDNGEWIDGANNQVLCFDPSSQEWTNPKCYGTAPCPRFYHASTVVVDHVWLFGGYSPYFNSDLNDLYQFDLMSLTWTEIAIPLTKPDKRAFCTLNAVSEHQILMHGGSYEIAEGQNDTWGFDIQSLSWKQYAADKKFTWNGHTGTTGLGRSVIIIGGVNVSRGYCDEEEEEEDDDDNDENDGDNDNNDNNNIDHDYDDDDNDDDIDDDDDDVDENGNCSDNSCTCAKIVTAIRLEPKSLQHLAIRIVNQNQKVLPWKSCLLKQLTDLFLVRESC